MNNARAASGGGVSFYLGGDVVDMAEIPEGGTSDTRLRSLLSELGATLASHLAHEEADALPLISQIMTHAELTVIRKTIAKMSGLKQAAATFPWALSSASPDVRAQVLRQLPAPARLLYRARWLPRLHPHHPAAVTTSAPDLVAARGSCRREHQQAISEGRPIMSRSVAAPAAMPAQESRTPAGRQPVDDHGPDRGT
jgi:hypothetical protein